MASARTIFSGEIKPGRRLSLQLISLIFSGYLIIAMSFTTWQISMEYINERDNLDSQINSLATTFNPTLSEALWNYDEDQISASLSGMYRTPEISGVSILGGPAKAYHIGEITTEDGKREMHTPDDSFSKGDSKWKQVYDELYSSVYELYSPEDDQEKLGEMKIYYSSTTVIERTYKTFIITIITALLKTISLWIITYLVIRRVVNRPIRELQSNIVELDLDLKEYKEYSPLKEEEIAHANELAILQSCFDALCWELKNKNIEVEAHKNNLEDEVKERTRELCEALVDLERSNKAKSDFLCSMSHELRTPLNSIIGFSRRMVTRKASQFDEKTLNSLKIILNNGEHLLLLINDILDSSKAESGVLDLDFQTFVLQPVLDDVYATMSTLALDKQIRFEVAASPVEEVYADPLKIKQILLNLISNAIKFTDDGSVLVTLATEDRESTKGIVFKVTDTGSGISEEDLPRIFIEFEQLENAQSISLSGTGLGLPIVKKLVKLHKGDITVKSEVGVGSEFCVWIPIEMESSID